MSKSFRCIDPLTLIHCQHFLDQKFCFLCHTIPFWRWELWTWWKKKLFTYFEVKNLIFSVKTEDDRLNFYKHSLLSRYPLLQKTFSGKVGNMKLLWFNFVPDLNYIFLSFGFGDVWWWVWQQWEITINWSTPIFMSFVAISSTVEPLLTATSLQLSLSLSRQTIDSCLKPLYNSHLFPTATFFCL